MMGGCHHPTFHIVDSKEEAIKKVKEVTQWYYRMKGGSEFDPYCLLTGGSRVLILKVEEMCPFPTR
jgi:hypothetical protein